MRNQEIEKSPRRVLQSRCPVCGSGDTESFVEIRGVPVHCNVLSPSREHALRVKRGDLEMRCCQDCSHVYNGAFLSEETDYGSEYENSLFFSEKYREYASSVAQDLIDRFRVHGKKVLEIGCGSGDFLKLLCDRGGNDGVGFDPSASGGRAIGQHPRITFVRDYYSAQHDHLDADFLCCRHVLEHIEYPPRFLKGIAEGLPGRKKVGLFFEVPDVTSILKEHSSWDLIYEHRSYFSMSSLHRLFSMCGFKVREIRRTFHDQFLCVYAEPEIRMTRESGTTFDGDKKDVLLDAKKFGKVFQGQVQAWERGLRFLGESKARVVVWGAGSKGVTFLNLLRGDGPVEYVVDVSERKWGKYVPVSGQKIVSPDFLREYQPDALILMNPAYEPEVRKTLEGMRLHPTVLQASHPLIHLKGKRS